MCVCVCVTQSRHTSATRRGSALHGTGLVEPALQKRLRAASLDCAQALILAMLQGGAAGGGGGGKGRNGGVGGRYEGRPVVEVVAAEVVGVAGRVGGGADGADGWVFCRDLEFRHSLAARLAGTGDGGVVEEAVGALREALARKKKRTAAMGGAHGESGAASGAGSGGKAEAGANIDLEKISQVRDILGAELGQGFVAAMLKWLDNSVEGVIQALLEVGPACVRRE